MMVAFVHLAALLAIVQAQATLLPRDTCPINPSALGGVTIELVSDFAPFVQQTYGADHSYVFFAHGMSSAGRWYVKNKAVCAELKDFQGCGEFRLDHQGAIYIIDNDGGVSKYLQRKGRLLKCL